MMISPASFAAEHEGKSYRELIAVRDELMVEIKAYENGTIPQEEYAINPDPGVRYWCNLEYMIEICKLIEAAYNAESEEEDEEDLESVDYAEEYARQTDSAMDDNNTEPVDYVKKYEAETGRDFETGKPLTFD